MCVEVEKHNTHKHMECAALVPALHIPFLRSKQPVFTMYDLSHSDLVGQPGYYCLSSLLGRGGGGLERLTESGQKATLETMAATDLKSQITSLPHQDQDSPLDSGLLHQLSMDTSCQRLAHFGVYDLRQKHSCMDNLKKHFKCNYS